jgi:hypothetical protein
MFYRRNSDASLRDLERQTAQEPSLGLRLYYTRRREGQSISLIDYQALAGYELSGGEIPYQIDLELDFPYQIARRIWDELPSLQAWYRLKKVQRTEWKSWMDEHHPGIGTFYGIVDDHLAQEAERQHDTIIVSLTNSELAELWVRDIRSRLINIREGDVFEDWSSKELKIVVDGVHHINHDELFEIVYTVDTKNQPIENRGSIFTLYFKPECCYDTEWSPRGTVMVSATGRVSGGSFAKSYEVSYFIEYGRFYRQVVPEKFQQSPKLGERHAPDHISIYDYISPMHPISSTRETREQMIERGIPVNEPLTYFVNSEHLMEQMRERYQWLVPPDAGRPPGYQHYFENYVHSYNEHGGASAIGSNKKLMGTQYYHRNYPHVWQLDRLLGSRKSQKRIKLLNLLEIPHKGGKIPADVEGNFFFQNYRFILYPSRGGKHRLYIECPVTGREIPIGRWTQYSPTLLKPQ